MQTVIILIKMARLNPDLTATQAKAEFLMISVKLRDAISAQLAKARDTAIPVSKLVYKRSKLRTSLVIRAASRELQLHVLSLKINPAQKSRRVSFRLNNFKCCSNCTKKYLVQRSLFNATVDLSTRSAGAVSFKRAAVADKLGARNDHQVSNALQAITFGQQ